MQAGIDDEPHGAQHFVVITALQLIRVLEHAKLGAERFGIKRPAFDERRIAAKALERRQTRVFLRQADLEMMSGYAFVEIKRLDARRGARRQIIGVEIKYPRPRTIGRAALIAAAGVILFTESRHRADFELGFGQGAEQRRHRRIDALADVIIALGQVLLRFGLELGIAADEIEKLLQCPLVADLRLDGLHALCNPRHFGQADGVNLFRRHVGCRRRGD